jgi:choline-sulfatase
VIALPLPAPKPDPPPARHPTSWAPKFLRRCVAWGTTLALALAVPGALIDFLLLADSGGSHAVRPAVAAAFAVIALSIWLGLGAGPIFAVLAALAERLGHARSWVRWLWPLPIVAAELGIAWSITGLTRQMHPSFHLAMMAGFVVLVLVAAELKDARHRVFRYLPAGVAAVVCLYVDFWLPGTLYREIHDFAFVASVAMVLTVTVTLRNRLMAAPLRDVILILVLMPLSAAVLGRAVDSYAPGWYSKAWLHGRHAPRMARFLRSVVDLDGDGFSPVAWGTDCDDLDPARNPLAADSPGGPDWNCNHAKPSANPSDADRSLSPPFGDPDAAPGSIDLVLLVTIDTFRADALGPDTTPNLVALGHRGVTFTHLYAGGSRTRQSLPLLNEAVATKRISVASRVAASGVTTSAIFSLFDPQLVSTLSGFAHVERPTSGEWNAAHITEAALADLRAHPEKHYLWVHYIDAHYPYLLYSGTSPLLKPDDRKVEQTRYLEELHLIDAEVGRIFDALRADGRADRALILVTSDHGEGFGEHGIWFHGVSGFEEIVHVPGILAGPGVPAGRYHGLTSHRDIPPTILGAFGLLSGEPDGEHFGRSWLRLRVSLGQPLHRFVVTHTAGYAAGEEGQQPMALIAEGSHRLTVAFEDGLVAMYDLSLDPGERNESSADEPQTAAELRAHLELYRDIEGFP